MVSGQFGLGYLINTSYTTVQYPTIVIAMITLGAVGYLTSALVRFAGDWLDGLARAPARFGRRPMNAPPPACAAPRGAIEIDGGR